VEWNLLGMLAYFESVAPKSGIILLIKVTGFQRSCEILDELLVVRMDTPEVGNCYQVWVKI
jgi:hypothetical protein